MDDGTEPLPGVPEEVSVGEIVCVLGVGVGVRQERCLGKGPRGCV